MLCTVAISELERPFGVEIREKKKKKEKCQHSPEFRQQRQGTFKFACFYISAFIKIDTCESRTPEKFRSLEIGISLIFTGTNFSLNEMLPLRLMFHDEDTPLLTVGFEKFPTKRHRGRSFRSVD